MTFILDVGGEGRHPAAWNLNPSPVKTLGRQRGERIPRHIAGRADAIPCPDRSVDRILVERTPLTRAAIQELARVIAKDGVIVLRHAVPPQIDPHALARNLLPGRMIRRRAEVGHQILQESCFYVGQASPIVDQENGTA